MIPILMLTVHHVLYNVKNVLSLLIIVIFVLLPDFKDLNHIVLVIGTNMLMLTESVKNVTINVTLVKPPLKTVLLVNISEVQSLNVHVQPDGMNSLVKKIQLVMNVTQDVLNVLVLKIIVKNVLMIELTLTLFQNHVHVSMDGLKLTESVKNVTQSIVKPVPTPLPLV